MVFDSDTAPGRIVFVAPEQLKDGTPIVMIIEPPRNKDGGMRVSLLVNAYDKDSGLPLRKWVEGTKQGGSLLRYYDKEKSSVLVDRSGLYLARLSQARSFKGKIYQDTDLVKYHNNNGHSLPHGFAN